jgi:hypothetical protein
VVVSRVACIAVWPDAEGMPKQNFADLSVRTRVLIVAAGAVQISLFYCGSS